MFVSAYVTLYCICKRLSGENKEMFWKGWLDFYTPIHTEQLGLF